MHDMTTRVLLLIILVGNAVVGLWAAIAPQSFYDSFPGGGRAYCFRYAWPDVSSFAAD